MFAFFSVLMAALLLICVASFLKPIWNTYMYEGSRAALARAFALLLVIAEFALSSVLPVGFSPFSGLYRSIRNRLA